MFNLTFIQVFTDKKINYIFWKIKKRSEKDIESFFAEKDKKKKNFWGNRIMNVLKQFLSGTKLKYSMKI